MSSPFSTDNAPQLGRALLRVSPLVISSASLMFSWAQDVSLGAFTTPTLRNDASHPSGTILPRYLPAFLNAGLWGIGLTYIPATILCIVNGLSGQSRDVRNLYFAGGALSISHFYWAPPMITLLQRIMEPKDAGVPNEEALDTWLSKHRSRTFLVNVPAFLVILGATLTTITEGLQ